MVPVVGRLAPTPSGHLHLGNVLAFAAAWLSARHAGGRVLLRIEDVDQSRARPDVEASFRDTLDWLGFDWDEETTPQRERDYTPFLNLLKPHLYRCICTRQMIRDAGGTYPGTCRDAGHREGAVRFRLPSCIVRYNDRRYGPQATDLTEVADPVMRRRDGVFAYNLAVVSDDLADGVTEVVRGADLLDQVAVQTQIWEALGATPPTWLHIPVVYGPDGRKLSKSHGASEIRAMRAAGLTPAEIWLQVLPWLGLSDVASLSDAVPHFAAKGPTAPIPLLEPPTNQ